MHKSVLITGITGFLGSHIGSYFISKGYSVAGIKRISSDIWRCNDYHGKVHWINNDSSDWKNKVIELNPDIIIHAAWDGIVSDLRNDLKQQLDNLQFTSDILTLAKETAVERLISFGSQAEYGPLNKIVAEEDPLHPDSAYGIAKVLGFKMTELFCELHSINWYWLRVFSVFGDKESPQWLIPSVINQLLEKKGELAFSEATQKYAYLFIDDFVKMIFEVANKDPKPHSGAYNISAKNAVSLRKIIEKIKILSDSEDSILNFGKLPLRSGQSMHIEGDMSKFSKNISPITYSDLDDSLDKTVRYYRSRSVN